MNYIAIDLGATSGRTILATVTENSISMREITRFSNHLIEMRNHYYWDIYALYNEIIKGLKVVARENIKIESIGIDTWGVDFVFIGKDGDILRNPYAYRDPQTEKAPEDFSKLISKRELYDITGLQELNFNSLYQLYALKNSKSVALENAEKILFIPDALSYLLTGKMVTEYTIASTSQMLNASTRELDSKLLYLLGMEKSQFAEIILPGKMIGFLTPEIQKMTGLGEIPVIAVAGHDTASAVAAIPALDKDFAYLSSGTWSLMGIEVDKPIINDKSYELNFTNEGGIDGTIRFLKNICGMWLLEKCRDEWTDNGNEFSYPDICKAALQCKGFRSFINPDDKCFANPDSMIKAIKNYCKDTNQPIPESYGEIARCIFESLALRYRQVLSYLKTLAPFEIKRLYIIGGGSKNQLLNQFTSNAIGMPVTAGPSECTAIGNIMVQAKHKQYIENLSQMREVISNSIELDNYEPEDSDIWDKAYETYLAITKS